MNRNFNIIFKYSLAEKIKTKSFLIMSIIIGIIAIGGTLINPLMTKFSSKQGLNVGIYQNQDYKTSIEAFSKSNKLNYNVKVTDDKKDEKEDVIIDVDNNSVYVNKDISYEDQNYIGMYLNQIRIYKIAVENNISESALKDLNTQIDVNYIYSKESNQFDARLFWINYVFVFLSYFLLLMSMQYIGQEIYQEKSSRAMEIIMTNVEPHAHMYAKILANVIYLFVFLIEGLIFAMIGLTIGNIIMDKPAFDYFSVINTLFEGINNSQLLGFTGITFILFIIVMVIILQITAILSSTATSAEDYQKAIMPIMMLVVLGFMIGITVQSNNILRILSILPVFNFYIIPGLILKGSISVLLIVVSILISLVFIILINIFGVKIYRFGVLNYASQPIITIIKQALRSK